MSQPPDVLKELLAELDGDETRLQQQCDSKEKEIAAQQEELKALRAQADEINVARRVILKKYRASGASVSASPEQAPIEGEEPDEDGEPEGRFSGLGKMNLTEVAILALREVGRVMPLPELAQYLLDNGYPYERGLTRLRDSLGVALLREHRSTGGILFKRGPGEYGLKEWEAGEGGWETGEVEVASPPSVLYA